MFFKKQSYRSRLHLSYNLITIIEHKTNFISRSLQYIYKIEIYLRLYLTEEAGIPLVQRSNNYREDNNCSLQARAAINEVSILTQPYNQHSIVTKNTSEVQSIETKKNSTIYHFEYGKKQYYTTVMTTTTESKHTMPIIPTDTTTTCVLISPMSTPSTICDIETLDLATETLPAVDTAAACDKAAVR